MVEMQLLLMLMHFKSCPCFMDEHEKTFDSANEQVECDPKLSKAYGTVDAKGEVLNAVWECVPCGLVLIRCYTVHCDCEKEASTTLIWSMMHMHETFQIFRNSNSN